MSRRVHRSFAPPQSGYTLLELLIAMTIGGVMIGSVLLAVSGTGVTGRGQSALTQFTEDGQVAISIISNQLRMAGFWVPDSPLPSLDTAQSMIFGCENGFDDPSAAFDALACAGAGDSDAIAIRYDARPLPQAGSIAVDCLGAAGGTINAADGGMAYNRFYIANDPGGDPALYCRGNGSASGQALISNVESMQITYGVAAIAAAPPGPILFDESIFAGSTVRYVDADFFDTIACPRNAPNQNAWCSVTSIRVCLLMRSEDNRAEEINTEYTDCDGNVTSQADRRLRRAMTTTISLRNRTG